MGWVKSGDKEDGAEVILIPGGDWTSLNADWRLDGRLTTLKDSGLNCQQVQSGSCWDGGFDSDALFGSKPAIGLLEPGSQTASLCKWERIPPQ